MKRLLFVILIFVLLCEAKTAAALPIPLEILDVYSSVTVQDFSVPRADWIYIEEHGVSASALTITYDLGAMFGDQHGEILVDPNNGEVIARGFSHTHIVPSPFAEAFSSWGKHVVLSKIVVPDTGSEKTEVIINVEVLNSDDGQALMRVIPQAQWDSNNFLPNGYTSWLGVAPPSSQYVYPFYPNEIVYLAFGIEPGVGIFGSVPEFHNHDLIEVKYSVFTRTGPIPELSQTIYFITGIGFFFFKKLRFI
ncbi:MAG TPA: hypothetical protein VD998_00240 [Verrucomicrobiae bacterium]|nr:hypothetical protein [Verrucomicrobiae bacterium]